MAELGMPVMEVFVRKDSAGRLQRQACVVREADKQADADGAAKNPLELLSAGAPALLAGSIVYTFTCLVSGLLTSPCMSIHTYHTTALSQEPPDSPPSSAAPVLGLSVQCLKKSAVGESGV